MEFQHPMFARNGVRNLKEIKRGNQPKKQDNEDGMEAALIDEGGDGGSAPAPKKARHDYSAFKTDVARLQKNLDAFEADLKEHTMQVQLKLACTRTLPAASCTGRAHSPHSPHGRPTDPRARTSRCAPVRACRHSLGARRSRSTDCHG